MTTFIEFSKQWKHASAFAIKDGIICGRCEDFLSKFDVDNIHWVGQRAKIDHLRLISLILPAYCLLNNKYFIDAGNVFYFLEE